MTRTLNAANAAQYAVVNTYFWQGVWYFGVELRNMQTHRMDAAYDSRTMGNNNVDFMRATSNHTPLNNGGFNSEKEAQRAGEWFGECKRIR